MTDPPRTAPLTAEQIAAIRANAVASSANGYPYIPCATVIAMADEIVALREANAEVPEGLAQWTTDELLDELEARSACYRATKTEADLVREVAALRDRLARAEEREGELRAALQRIKNDEGRVCNQYEICDHVACNSSYAAWAIADAALAPRSGRAND